MVSPTLPDFDIGAYHKPIPDNKLCNLVDFAKANGALTILAHPYRRDKPLAIDIAKNHIDCIEIASRNTPVHQRQHIIQTAEHYDMVCVSTSDAHKTKHIGNYCIDLDCEPDLTMTEDELAQLVKQGRFTLMEKRLAPVIELRRN